MFGVGFIIGLFLCLFLCAIFKKAFLNFCMNFNYSDFVIACMERVALTIWLIGCVLVVVIMFIAVLHFVGVV